MIDAPFMMCVGLNIPDVRADLVATFDDWYTQVHLPDLVECNPGFVRGSRYRLVGSESDLGLPQWLVLYEFNGLDAVHSYVARINGPPEAIPIYRWFTDLEMTLEWRMIWRRVSGVPGSLGGRGAPYLYLVGNGPPAASSPEEQEEFDTFATRAHIPEVVDACHFLGATRYEILHDIVHPDPGAPRYLTAYEGDESSLVRYFDAPSFPAPSGGYSEPGPSAWSNREFSWALTYRRIASYARAALL